ncbi:MAG: hypothetical protein HN560_04410 [Anaerolineae bacterium]|nr:hypothetical protein [Anaerolineae bacterium]
MGLIRIRSFTHSLIFLAFLLLPFSHFRWLPNLGLTRPITAVLLVFALLLLFLSKISSNRWALPAVPGWNVLRWFFLVVIFGGISTLTTIFYGGFWQACVRLLGYIIVFSFLYMAMYVISHWGMGWVARIIVIGYIPAMLYGLIEALAVAGWMYAETIVYIIREYVVVVNGWAGRLSLFTTEPSFLAFQLLLLIFCLPFLRQRTLRLSACFLIMLIAVFSQSLTVVFTLALYLGLRFFMSGNIAYKALVLSVGGLSGILVAKLPILYPIAYRLENISRDVSLQIRLSYVYNLFYSLFDTWGAGFGIGQYGLFWKDVYLQNIDYSSFDKFGEVANTLASTAYMKPWSLILGIGVDLGIIGLFVFLIFLYKTWKSCITSHDKAVFIVAIILLMGAYPIVTPHIWLIIGFIIAKKYASLTHQLSQK